MLDEPTNGLDPEGIVWIRNLMRVLAAEGRTVIVSSHLMSEMEHIADHVLVMGRGRLIADCTVDEFIAAGSQHRVRVRTPQPEELTRLVATAGGTVRNDGEGVVVVSGLETARIWDLAFENASPAGRARAYARVAGASVHGADRRPAWSAAPTSPISEYRRKRIPDMTANRDDR